MTALAAIADGKQEEAVKVLEKVLEATPSDVVAFSLHAAASFDLTERRLAAARRLAALRPLRAEPLAPPHKNPGAGKAAPPPTLQKLSESSNVVDWFTWLGGVGIEEPVQHSGDLPAMFASELGDQGLFERYPQDGFLVARYGPSTLVIGKEGAGVRALRLDDQLVAAFQNSLSGKQVGPDSLFPEVRFAAVVGSSLIAQLVLDGDGGAIKSNAAVVAIDLESDKTSWITDDHTGNSQTSYATGSHLVTAFAEDNSAKLQVVDLATGQVVASQPLSFPASHVVGKEGKVYAWGPGKLAAFQLGHAPARPAAKLGKLSPGDATAAATMDASARCHLENAIIALDHRDAKAVLAAQAKLPETSGASKVLRAAGDFLLARADGVRGIDLTEKQPVPVELVASARVRADGPKPKPVTTRVTAAKDPALDPPKKQFGQGPRPLYSRKRLDHYPQRYGTGSIRGAFSHEDETYLLYGNRYVVVVKDEQVDKIWDLLPLVGPKRPGVSTATSFETVIDGVVYAVVSPQVTYHAHGSTMSSSYVVAFDPGSGKVLWRTPAGVVPAPFLVFEEALITVQAKGTNHEIAIYRLSDGRLVSTTAVKGPINTFHWDGRGALVLTPPSSVNKQYFQVKT